MIITEEDIRRQMARVNTENLEEDYQNLRRLQKEFAADLVRRHGTSFGIHRTYLRFLRPEDFPFGTILRVGPFRVICNGRCTSAFHIKTLKDLRSEDVPAYLRSFIGI